MDKNKFLEKFGITVEDFNKTSLKWEDLLEIKKDYELLISEFESIGRNIIDILLKCNQVHSVRYRVKNSEHVIEKIIRKKKDNPSRILNINTYKDELTDLIGVRVLHFFKEDWTVIDQFIKDRWNLLENQPIAYYREGDTTNIYEDNGCKPERHPKNYRSVHYVIESSPTKFKNFIEIQVRTIFEEGWSEIDHKLRYKKEDGNILLTQLLDILNRLSGTSDELASRILNQINIYKLYTDKYKELEDIQKRKEIEQKTFLESKDNIKEIKTHFETFKGKNISETEYNKFIEEFNKLENNLNSITSMEEPKLDSKIPINKDMITEFFNSILSPSKNNSGINMEKFIRTLEKVPDKNSNENKE